MSPPYARLVDARLSALFDGLAAINIEGARGVGKTWTASRHARTFIAVDELDAKLHPKLLRFVILLFKNPEINRNGAQLFFTSQDVSTMRNDVFRRDEIWFAAKDEDESSQLWSLADIHESNGNLVSKNAAFDRQYLAGRYGADPYLSRMEEWVLAHE